MKVVVLSSLRSTPPRAAATELGLDDEDVLVVIRQTGPESHPVRSTPPSAPTPSPSTTTSPTGVTGTGGPQPRPSATGVGGRSLGTRLRKAVRAVSPGLSAMKFAREVLGPSRRRDLEGADLVVATDADTHLAAWLVARRLPRACPVVAGTSAGARVVEQVRARDGGSGLSEPAS